MAGGYVGLLIAAAVALNVGAQVATKYLGRKGLSALQDWVSPWIVAAVLMYFISFLFVAKILSRLPLSVASPVLAGGSFILAAIAGYVLFGEQIGLMRWVGMGLIAVGIVCVGK